MNGQATSANKQKIEIFDNLLKGLSLNTGEELIVPPAVRISI